MFYDFGMEEIVFRIFLSSIGAQHTNGKKGSLVHAIPSELVGYIDKNEVINVTSKAGLP